MHGATETLAKLPNEEALRSLREQVNTARQQLPFLQQRDRAEAALETIGKQRAALALSGERLPSLDLLLTSREQAQNAKDLLPCLTALERASEERNGKEAAMQGKERERERLQVEIASATQLQSQRSERLGLAQQARDGAQNAVSQCHARYVAAKEAVEKREETRGSQTCAFCGQLISEEHLQADFALARAAERDARQSFDDAKDAVEVSQNGLEEAQRGKKDVDQVLVEKQKQLTALVADLKNLTERLGELDKEILFSEEQLPEDNAMDAVQAQAKAGELASIDKTIGEWNEVTKRHETLNGETNGHRQNREEAINALPAVPFSTEEAQCLVDQEKPLLQNEQAFREAVSKRDRSSDLLEERRVHWEDAVHRLPDGPERKLPISILEGELAALADAPKKQADLERAADAQERIRVDRERNTEAIQEIPEAARRPLAEIALQLQNSATELQTAQKRHGDAETLHAQLIERQERRAEAETNMERAENQAKLWKELDKQLGPPLQNWLLKEAEGQILEYANTYLDAFSQGHMALEQREDSSIPLDLICRNDLVGGRNESLQGLSGSQKFRVAVSLALALGQYASMSSQRIQSVIIDEGFGGLDTDGQREMSNELRNLASRLERLIVVSHQETFADAFEDRYHIRIENGGSVPVRVKLA